MKRRNVFQIWTDLGEKVPFAVHKERWHPQTYYIVSKIEITEKNRDYQKKTGNMYGKAWGDFYQRNTLRRRNEEIQLAGTYEWDLIKDVNLEPVKKNELSPRST